MVCKLTKPVRRVTNETVRDGSKFRALVVSIYPAGFIGLRPQGTRREETIPTEAVFERAIKMRLAREAQERMQKKADKAGVSLAVYTRRKRGR